MAQQCGRPDTIFMGNGDGPPGSMGLVARSIDGGNTWKVARMQGRASRANSTVWNFAVHPANPHLIYATSVSGELFRSRDSGETWGKLAREFGEIRALTWAP